MDSHHTDGWYESAWYWIKGPRVAPFNLRLFYFYTFEYPECKLSDVSTFISSRKMFQEAVQTSDIMTINFGKKQSSIPGISQDFSVFGFSHFEVHF